MTTYQTWTLEQLRAERAAVEAALRAKGVYAPVKTGTCRA